MFHARVAFYEDFFSLNFLIILVTTLGGLTTIIFMWPPDYLRRKFIPITIKARAAPISQQIGGKIRIASATIPQRTRI